MRTRYVLGLAIAAAVGAFTTPSRASDIVCGSTTAGWNVPNGAAAFTQTDGPVKSVVNAIGEYRSHSMLSRGPGGWVTHATSLTPPTNPSRGFLGSECSAPVDQNFLYNALPGMETISQGSIYTFLYKGGTNTFLAYQNGGAGAPTVGNMFLGAGMGWSGWWSPTDSSQYVWGMTYNGAQTHYGWYQYMNSQASAAGVPGVNTGLICSTSLAAWQHDALGGGAAGAYTGDVKPRTYAPGAIKPAANALYNAVYAACSSATDFWASFSNALSAIGECALCFDCNLCDEAADQVTNCFATNNCGSSNGSVWNNAVSNTSAVTISPDDAACWNGNGTGAPCSGAGSSIWGYDINQTVQWNSGGNQYSCWD